MTSGADWNKILAEDPTLDLSGVDIATVTERLGVLEDAELQDLIAAVDAERVKAEKRGDIIDTALDVFKAVLTALV